MRLRLVVLACVLTAIGTVVTPTLASAAPRHNHHLTIAATPNPVPAGEGVVIYGRLFGSDNAGQPVTLYHHISGSGQGYTLVQTTTTDTSGYYEFTRAEGVVLTNRSWFVRGPNGSHSRTMYERAIALVSLTASSMSTDTKTPITFTGTVTPNHPFERVALQQQDGSSDDWSTLKTGFTDGTSGYSIQYRWRRPGMHDVRVVFPDDFRNRRGVSDPVTITVQQAQVPDFTINASNPIVDEGSPVTISGVLHMPGSTSAPDPNAVVQLWGRTADQGDFAVLADATTGSDGSYTFTQPDLAANTVYYVATMSLGNTTRRHTARVYQGVRDVLTFQSSTTSATTGQTVTFTGTVLPDKAGHSIYLQKLGKDGDWHTVEVGTVRGDSTFQFNWTIGAPGNHEFRARITSDAANVGTASAPLTVTATAPPATSLPPAS
jgi:plastocyanin